LVFRLYRVRQWRGRTGRTLEFLWHFTWFKLTLTHPPPDSHRY